MVRTSCYETVLGTAGTKDDPEELSSALFCDAQVVDSPHEARTFWLPADACPTTNLEAVAKTIFDFHSTSQKHLFPRQGSTAPGDSSTSRGTAREGMPGKSDVANVMRSAAAHCKDGHDDFDESGAEWWVQLREEGHHEDLGMPFHWDKDENLVETNGVVVCPQVSTVTYLTDYGAPTVVLEVGATGEGIVEEGDIERAFVSYPAPFKHLAFDGSFLHGVPEQLMRKSAHRMTQGGQDKSQAEDASVKGNRNNDRTKCSSAFLPRRRQHGRVRATLLVNIWMSHKPAGIAPLPADIVASLTRRHRGPSRRSLLSFDRSVDFTPVMVDTQSVVLPQQQEEAGVTTGTTYQASMMLISVPLGPTIFLELRVPTPETLSASGLKSLDSFEILYKEGCFSRISKWEKEEAGRVKRARASQPLARSSNEGTER